MGTEYAAPFTGQAIATSQEYRDRYRPTQPDMIDASYGAGDLLVSNAANVNVSIAIGNAVVQGALYKLTVSAHTLAVAANGGGSNRFDIVCLTYDASYSPGVYLRIVQGTPGAGLPALTNSSTGIWDFPLAHYEKQPGGNIVNMVDRRKFSDGQGNIVGGATSTFPQAPRVGSQLKIMPAGTLYEYDGATWQTINTGYDMLTYTPTWTADSGTTTLSNGTVDGRYRISDYKNVQAWFRYVRGSSSTQSISGANWRFNLPVIPNSDLGGTFYFANVWILDTDVSNRMVGHGYIVSGGWVETIMVDGGAGLTDNLIPMTWASGDRLNGYAQYPMA